MGPFKSIRDYLNAVDHLKLGIHIEDINQDDYEATGLIYKLIERYGVINAPVVFFDKPHEIVGIQVIPAVGMIPTSLIEEGYQCEASVASHDKSTPTVNAFLVMVLRK